MVGGMIMNIQSTLRFGLCLVLGAAPALAARPGDDKDAVPSHKPGFEQQDTGISDPTVNPGQAAGTRTIHGIVLRLQDRGYVIRDAKGHEVSVLIDEETTGDREVSPGDYIETTLTRQGRAITMTKQSPSDEPAMKGSSTK
jgi:uncharacterized protein YdeI (BOF family)